MIASAPTRYYVEKPFRLVCDPVWVPTSGHTLLVGDVVEAPIDGILFFATLITRTNLRPNSFLCTVRRPRSRA